MARQPTSSDYVGAGSFSGFHDCFQLLGGDPDSVLKEAGIDPSILNYPNKVIPLTKYRTALALAAEVTDTPSFGLLLSQHQSVESLGAIGYLLRHAPNLRTAISETTEHLKVHNSGNHIYLLDDGDKAVWCHQLTTIREEPSKQQCEHAIGLTVRYIRSIISNDWTADAIHFEHKFEGSSDYYNRVFKCPVSFEQPLNGVEFPSSLLDLPLKGADEGLYAILKNHVERLSDDISEAFSNKVRRSIQSQFEYGSPRLKNTAEDLGVTAHHLQRNLRRKGTSFQRLLQDVRIQLAQKYLKDTDFSLTEITSILALSEPAVLTRSFKKQVGITPSEWRRRFKTTSSTSQ